MVKISVIVPVYNVEDYLKECLDSILNQSLKEIEVICINDGSTDGSLEILKDYQINDTRVKVFSQQNKGLGCARNVGLEHAIGEYVFFIDSDDYIIEDTLFNLYSHAKEKNADMTLFKLLNFDNETRKTQPIKYFDIPFLKKYGESTFNCSDLGEKLYGVSVTAPGKLFKREIIEKLRFPEKLIFEDTPFVVESIFLCERMLFVDEYYYMRRVRKDSITRSNFSRFSDCIEIFNMVNDISRKYGYYDIYKELLFSRKYQNISTRFQEVNKRDKQEFFDKIKKDLILKEDEVKELDFDKVKPKAKHVYHSAFNSKDFNEFESSLKHEKNHNNKKTGFKKLISALKKKI